MYDGIGESKKNEPLQYIYYHWYFWYFGNYARKPLVLANSLNTTFKEKMVIVVVTERRVKSPPRYPIMEPEEGFAFNVAKVEAPIK